MAFKPLLSITGAQQAQAGGNLSPPTPGRFSPIADPTKFQETASCTCHFSTPVSYSRTPTMSAHLPHKGSVHLATQSLGKPETLAQDPGREAAESSEHKWWTLHCRSAAPILSAYLGPCHCCGSPHAGCTGGRGRQLSYQHGRVNHKRHHEPDVV